MLLADPVSVTAECKYSGGGASSRCRRSCGLGASISDDGSSYVCTLGCFNTAHSPLKIAHHCDGILKWNSRLALWYVGLEIITGDEV